MTSRVFALERYDHDGDALATAAPALPQGAGIRLIGVVHLPADEVLLALVEGPDADTVTTALMAAGWRIDRINPATWISPAAATGDPISQS